MNGNKNLSQAVMKSYDDMVGGAGLGNTSVAGMAPFRGPAAISGSSKYNRQSTSFVFNTRDLAQGKPLSLSKDTQGAVYQGGMQAGMG